MASPSIDARELQTLSANLGRASGQMVTDARAVIAKGSLNIKTDARENVSTSVYWRQIARTINYEQVGLLSEIGYDDVGQGELAGIYEFGSVKREPHPTLLPAFDREAPRFEKAIADLAGKVGDLL